MSNLTKIEIQSIRSLLEDDRWQVIEKVIELLNKRWDDDKTYGTDAYTELKDLHLKQGRKEALKVFIETLETQAIQSL